MNQQVCTQGSIPTYYSSEYTHKNTTRKNTCNLLVITRADSCVTELATSADLFSMEHLGTQFIHIFINEIQILTFKKMHFGNVICKTSIILFRPPCVWKVMHLEMSSANVGHESALCLLRGSTPHLQRHRLHRSDDYQETERIHHIRSPELTVEGIVFVPEMWRAYNVCVHYGVPFY